MYAPVEDPAGAGVALEVAPAPLAQPQARFLPVEGARLAELPAGYRPSSGPLLRRAAVVFRYGELTAIVHGRIDYLATGA